MVWIYPGVGLLILKIKLRYQIIVKNKIKLKWIDRDKLLTWQINNFSLFNPVIKSKIWFNQVLLIPQE